MKGWSELDKNAKQSLAGRLGKQSAEFDARALSDAAVSTAKVRLLDTLSCSMAGYDSRVGRVLAAQVDGATGHGASVMWGGGGQRLGPLEGVFLHATLAHALLHDDTDLEAGHVACMVVPAAITAAELAESHGLSVSGRELLGAIVVGYEVMWCAAGKGTVLAASLERGFRGYILSGALASAATAARVLQLNAEQTAHALSYAANNICGLLEPVAAGSDERALMAGANAQTGLHSALLARAGMVGTPSMIEGPRGYFFALTGKSMKVPSAWGEFDPDGRILESRLKLYPSAGANQAAIYVAEKASASNALEIDEIQSITVYQHPSFAGGVPRKDGSPSYPSLTSNGPYSSVEDILPNKPFAVAAAVVLGRFTPRDLDHALRDPRVLDLAARVQIAPAPAMGPWEAAIDIETSQGQLKLEGDCEAEGVLAIDMTQVADRFQRVAGHTTSGDYREGVTEAVSDIEGDGGVGALLRVLGRTRAG